MITCDLIESLSDYSARIQSHTENQKIRYYYRGESRTEQDGAARQLVPDLLRKSKLEKLSRVHDTDDPVMIQSRLLARLQRYVPASLWPGLNQAGCELSFGDRLCVAQHYGLPTLLLDWSLSPLAALFFAVNKHQNQNGRVWMMKLQPCENRKHCTCHLEEGSSFQESCKIPQLVVPKPFNRRMEVQVGRFIYFGECRTPLDEFDSFDNLPFQSITCVSIHANKKDKIMRELAHYQIHGGTMFPGLDGYARYLAQGGI